MPCLVTVYPAPATINDEFELLAHDYDENIMAFKHKKFKLWGVQFHPESILTEHGKILLKNWINT